MRTLQIIANNVLHVLQLANTILFFVQVFNCSIRLDFLSHCVDTSKTVKSFVRFVVISILSNETCKLRGIFINALLVFYSAENWVSKCVFRVGLQKHDFAEKGTNFHPKCQGIRTVHFLCRIIPLPFFGQNYLVVMVKEINSKWFELPPKVLETIEINFWLKVTWLSLAYLSYFFCASWIFSWLWDKSFLDASLLTFTTFLAQLLFSSFLTHCLSIPHLSLFILSLIQLGKLQYWIMKTESVVRPNSFWNRLKYNKHKHVILSVWIYNNE